jgi:ankyrin repeat protein
MASQALSDLPVEGQQELLFYAATEGRADVIQRVLSGNPDLKTSLDEEGCSPLHRAVAIGKVDAVRTLLRGGCPVDTVATSGPHAGKTPPQLTTDPALRVTFCAELLQSVMLEDEARTKGFFFFLVLSHITNYSSLNIDHECVYLHLYTILCYYSLEFVSVCV